MTGFDEEFRLAYLDFPGGRMAVGRGRLALGQRVRVQVHARDVSLTLARQEHTSILNILLARVAALAEDGETQVTVRPDCAGTPLLARITRKSAHLLGLRPGLKVYAQMKSVALME